MKIKNKIESSKKIKELHLNYFPEKIFKTGQENQVLSFIDEYPARFYAIRDKSKSGGNFKFKVERENVLQEIKEYNLFSLNISSFNYEDYQALVGEMMVSDDEIFIIASTNNKFSLRDVYKNPDFNLHTKIFDKALDKIPYFDKIYKYIVDKHLQNLVVEFALFSKPVGINEEDIIIYELRTDY